MEEKFTFFWNGPFSQWHNSTFKVGSETYNCAEQFMMVSKARAFDDLSVANRIMESKSPKEQKALGRIVKDFNDEEWDLVSWDVVYEGNYHKFTQNPDLLKLLMATEGTTLVEASPFDKIWGIGLAEDDPRALNKKTWLGKNRLGYILTELRDNLKKEKEGN